ncbi:MAG: PEP-CTERM sorting domain-containing protein [Verrucomicrobia bacterium]|nr:PEP-CTERM sorting domain-containing protein [Verrucomicrobiota bacterium]
MQSRILTPVFLAITLVLFGLASAHATIVYDFSGSNQSWTGAFESGSVINPFTWSSTAGVGGVGAWYTDGVASTSIKTLTSPEMTLQANGSVTISVTHRFNFEEGGFDGGQLRYRVNGGGWSLVPHSDFTSNGYLGGGVPIDGLNSEPGWGDQSSGFLTPAYITSSATVAGFTAGQTLEIQLRGGWDVDGSPVGPDWVIGQVEATNVVPEPSSYAAVFATGLLGYGFWRRTRRKL